MKYTIEIRTNNAAFDPDDVGEGFELARILRKLAADLETQGAHDIRLNDFNGNWVGEALVHDD